MGYFPAAAEFQIPMNEPELKHRQLSAEKGGRGRGALPAYREEGEGRTQQAGREGGSITQESRGEGEVKRRN